jgi:hypothetical protein
MPGKKSRKYTEVDNADKILKEVSIMPSTVETVDTAFFNYVNDTLNIFSESNKGWKKVPVLWVAAERAYQIKREKSLRDSKGVLKLPMITVNRTSVKKDPEMKGVAWAHIPERNDEKGGALTVARTINQRKTANFINADSYRKQGSISAATVGTGQINFPFKNPGKVVYNTISVPMPTYIVLEYDVVLRAEYQQQVNDMVTPFITKTGQINNFFIENEGHRFEGFIQGDFSQNNNVAEMGEDERMYETSVQIKILGYLLGEGPNRDRPKITSRENAVEVKIPREQVILGEIPWDDPTKTIKPFYKE